MVVGFTTTYAISAYHHYSCELESHSWRGVLDTTLCDKVCQRLATGWWFSQCTPVSSSNETDRHNITEILLKVTLNIITLFYEVIWFAYLHSSLPTFMNVSWRRSKARCRLFNFHEPCFMKLFI
jgi:hypothetical protein